jgi:hypothetical protein
MADDDDRPVVDPFDRLTEADLHVAQADLLNAKAAVLNAQAAADRSRTIKLLLTYLGLVVLILGVGTVGTIRNLQAHGARRDAISDCRSLANEVAQLANIDAFRFGLQGQKAVLQGGPPRTAAEQLAAIDLLVTRLDRVSVNRDGSTARCAEDPTAEGRALGAQQAQRRVVLAMALPPVGG